MNLIVAASILIILVALYKRRRDQKEETLNRKIKALEDEIKWLRGTLYKERLASIKERAEE